MRFTLMKKPNCVSQGSTPPVIGAAEAGSGVAASGMCPSPVNRAEVGSSPIQPAPGIYTSAHACRSVKSIGPRRAVKRLDIGLQLDQVAGNKAGRQAQVTQYLHQQPGRVTATAGSVGERFFARLHARLHPDHVLHLVVNQPVQFDEEIDGATARQRDPVDQFPKLRTQRSVFRYGRSSSPSQLA